MQQRLAAGPLGSLQRSPDPLAGLRRVYISKGRDGTLHRTMHKNKTPTRRAKTGAQVGIEHVDT